jgi:diamine N-acetyltransferase
MALTVRRAQPVGAGRGEPVLEVGMYSGGRDDDRTGRDRCRQPGSGAGCHGLGPPTRLRRHRAGADCPEGNPWYRAVVVDGSVVGFVMLSWNVTPDPPEIIGPWFLWKLIVDQQHQGRGIGAAVVQAVAAIVSAEGASELLTSFVPAEDGPAGFYARLGFVPTGDVDAEGETIVSLDV